MKRAIVLFIMFMVLAFGSYAPAYAEEPAPDTGNDAAVDLDAIETYEKVAEIPHEAGSDCVNGKSFDIVVIYVKRTSRDNGIAVQSADEGEGRQWVLRAPASGFSGTRAISLC